jgi:hypothetical protein
MRVEDARIGLVFVEMRGAVAHAGQGAGADLGAGEGTASARSAASSTTLSTMPSVERSPVPARAGRW